MPAYIDRRVLLGLLLTLSMFSVSALAASPEARTAQPDGQHNNAKSAALVLKVLPLKHGNADRLAHQLAPSVPPPGTIAAVNRQLVINSSAAGIAQIEALLQQLDAPPEALLLSIRFDAPAELMAQKRNNRHYQAGAPTAGAITQVRSQSHQPTGIAQSQSHQPLSLSRWGEIGTTQRQAEGYRLYATVELHHNQASVSLAMRRYQGDVTDPHRYDINTQITGPLGQWLALNPSAPNNPGEQSKHYLLPLSKDTIYLKVERLNKTTEAAKPQAY